MVAVLPILGEPPATVEPSDGSLHNPAFCFDNKTLRAVGALDDLDCQVRHSRGGAVVEDRSRVNAIREQLAQERELSEQRGQHQDTAVTILDIGGRHQRMQHQAQRVDQDMTLLALDQLATIEAVWVDAEPPFSALFTLWLSITQAVGLASRSACSRHLT